MLLIDDLLALPFKGFLGIFRKIQEMADRELNDETYIQQKLLELILVSDQHRLDNKLFADS